ncbi:hypothetical protein EVAR_64325_1 [Eumeta japonica]|uniref:Uncharacterized protein n=1 Tax=Eumeta variegata TaxID=151549 RepID=A0A4C1Z8T0_EUMVA|nr:hypothetical protein EVAR_64325_1 [Eumeta japonica]
MNTVSGSIRTYPTWKKVSRQVESEHTKDEAIWRITSDPFSLNLERYRWVQTILGAAVLMGASKKGENITSYSVVNGIAVVALEVYGSEPNHGGLVSTTSFQLNESFFQLGPNRFVVSPQLFSYVVRTNKLIMLYFFQNGIDFIRNGSTRARFIFDIKITKLKTLEPVL